MRYIFLVASIWNLSGGINFLFIPEKQAKDMGYLVGNRWESQYIAIMAFIFSAIYGMIFLRQPSGHMTFVPFFAIAKYLIGISSVYCHKKHAMPLKFAIIFGGGNFIIGILLTLYLIFA